jgi:hypothetical protein
MARPTHDIVATLGEYKAADGSKKKRYHTCGKAFTNDQGQISLKLDALPCSPEWSGWLSLYPVQEHAAPRPDPRPPAPEPRESPERVAARAKAEAAQAAREEDPDDDIPF